MIHQVYQQLRDAGFTDSQVHFSEVWLGRSPRYYSNLIATGRRPGIATLHALKGRLFRVALHVNVGAGVKVLCHCVEQLDEEIFRRIMFDIPKRRAAGAPSSAPTTTPPAQPAANALL